MSSPVILCVALNPAIDITHRVQRLRRGASHRVESVTVRAGGKATNVARAATILGAPAHLVAPLGGPSGDAFAAEVTAGCLALTRVGRTGDTRRSVAVVEDDGTATLLNEAGPPLEAEEWDAIHAAVEDALARGLSAGAVGVLVVSGSLPPGCPEDACGRLTELAHRHAVPVIVDTSGPPLRAALPAAPTIVKPNRDELVDIVRVPGREGALALRALAPDTVVVASDGPEGVLWAGPGPVLRARPEGPLTGNPTGAGDALVAGLAVGLVEGRGTEDTLRLAIGASGAAVLDPVAGHFDPVAAARLAATATITPEPS